MPEETKRKLKGRKGNKNPNWKGDNAGKNAFHKWISDNKPKPLFCEICNEKEPRDLANMKNHKYTRSPNDYKWLCVSCHRKFDFRSNHG